MTKRIVQNSAQKRSSGTSDENIRYLPFSSADYYSLQEKIARMLFFQRGKASDVLKYLVLQD